MLCESPYFRFEGKSIIFSDIFLKSVIGISNTTVRQIKCILSEQHHHELKLKHSFYQDQVEVMMYFDSIRVCLLRLKGSHSLSKSKKQGENCLTWCYYFVPYFGDWKYMAGDHINVSPFPQP